MASDHPDDSCLPRSPIDSNYPPMSSTAFQSLLLVSDHCPMSPTDLRCLQLPSNHFLMSPADPRICRKLLITCNESRRPLESATFPKRLMNPTYRCSPLLAPDHPPMSPTKFQSLLLVSNHPPMSPAILCSLQLASDYPLMSSAESRVSYSNL